MASAHMCPHHTPPLPHYPLCVSFCAMQEIEGWQSPAWSVPPTGHLLQEGELAFMDTRA